MDSLFDRIFGSFDFADVNGSSGPTLQEMRCPVCGQYFAVEERLYKVRRSSAEVIHCPNGHKLRTKAS